MKNKVSKWPKNLLQALSSHNMTIFFGAGVTKELGFPLWNEFIDTLEKEVTIDENQQLNVSYLKKEQKFPEIVQIFLDSNREETANLIMTTFNKDIDDSYLNDSNETLIFKLNASNYITTNVDNSVEFAKAKAGKKTAQVYWYGQENDIRDKTISKNYETDPLIIRVHGSLDNTNSLIFSKDQYTKLVAEKTFVFDQLLPALFITTTVLFIGYSVQDPDIKNILENVTSKEAIQSNIFLLTSDTNSDTKDLEKLGVRVIEGDNNKDSETENLKENLKELVKLSTIFENKGNKSIRKILSLGEKTRNDKIQQLLNE